ncbi:MAG: hypothetical protein FWF44_08440 [Defluviitaleaceae bacterium]|nr:hypothetical protein [Defluviitaleaceae bacterium]
MSVAEMVFFGIAIFGTVMLALQVIMQLVGIGGGNELSHDFEHDISHEISHDINHEAMGHADHEAAHDHLHNMENAAKFGWSNLFTVRGIVAFLAIGGWTGVLLLQGRMVLLGSLLIAVVAGFVAMMVVGLLLYAMSHSDNDGSMVQSSLIGCEAQVYVPIPANGAGKGNVTLTVQNRFMEYPAKTMDRDALKYKDAVKVLSIVDGNVLVVSKLHPQYNEN